MLTFTAHDLPSRDSPSPLPVVRPSIPSEGRSVSWMFAGPLVPTFADRLPGERLSLVGQLKCWDSAHDAHLFNSLSDGISFLAVGLIDGSNDSYTLMNALMKSQHPRPILVIDEETRVFRHEPPSWDSICAVIELCSGFGGMAQGISACGFHSVVAVDFNEKMCQLYERQSDIPTIAGDVNDLETVCKVWHVAKGAGNNGRRFRLPAIFKAGRPERGTGCQSSISQRYPPDGLFCPSASSGVGMCHSSCFKPVRERGDPEVFGYHEVFMQPSGTSTQRHLAIKTFTIMVVDYCSIYRKDSFGPMAEIMCCCQGEPGPSRYLAMGCF